MPVPKRGNEKLPVTYIGVDEARAFCADQGKRLPREEEWQHAGQGFESERVYPWPDQNVNTSAMMPRMQTGRRFEGPEAVDAHAPGSDSVFGVSDLLGNVWQMTDVYQDAHTSSVVLRGGSCYRPQGSPWYLLRPKFL